MKRLIFIITVFFSFNKILCSQSLLYRSSYRHEIYLTGRVDKDYRYILPSIGYEFSFNKNKRYLSLATEYLTPLFTYRNIDNALMPTLKINFQSQHITSLGIGFKQNFKSKQTNFVAVAGYKYDFSKYKLTFSANVLLEIYKTVQNTLGSGAPVCLRNCPKRFYLWRYGIAVGRYF